MRLAIRMHRENDETQHHKDWIRSLLVDYYDPMYDYQTSAKKDRVVFQGERDAVIDFLGQNYSLA